MERLSRLALLLRLAVLFNRGRNQQELPLIPITVDNTQVTLTLETDWLKKHALTQADLENEQSSLGKSMFILRVKVSG